jgi:thioredoxin-related protein
MKSYLNILLISVTVFFLGALAVNSLDSNSVSVFLSLLVAFLLPLIIKDIVKEIPKYGYLLLSVVPLIFIGISLPPYIHELPFITKLKGPFFFLSIFYFIGFLFRGRRLSLGIFILGIFIIGNYFFLVYPFYNKDLANLALIREASDFDENAFNNKIEIAESSIDTGLLFSSKTIFYNKDGNEVLITPPPKGKFLLIETWTKSCTPCLKAMKELSGYIQNNDKRLLNYYIHPITKNKSDIEKLSTINYVDDKNKLLYIHSNKLKYIVNEITVPVFALFNDKGEVLLKRVGYSNKENMISMLEEAMK